MKQLNFKSKSPLLPSIDISLHNYQLSEELTKELSEVIVKEESNILQNTTPFDGERDPTWITARLWQYNFLNFDYPEVKQLKEIISDEYKNYMHAIGVTPEPVYIQCWINILRNNGRIITPHNHASAHTGANEEYSYVSGNISIQTNDTATMFANPFLGRTQFIPVPNNNGEMLLFPSFVVHCTTENKSDTPRYTIAFDIITEHVYNIIQNTNFIKLC
jgi:hypothetical protein